MKVVTSHQDYKQEVEQHRWLLVYFTASWCGPCSSFSPVMDKVSGAFESILTSIKVDVEDVPEAAGEMEIRSVPSLLLFEHGKPVEGIVGAQSFEKVSDWLMSHLLVF